MPDSHIHFVCSMLDIEAHRKQVNGSKDKATNYQFTDFHQLEELNKHNKGWQLSI